MSQDRPVTISLTSTQIAQVMRGASGLVGVSAMLAGLEQSEALHEVIGPLLVDDTYSRSTLRALLVLDGFPAEGTEREVTDVARQLELSPSTAHRYIHTWMALGLLEQDPVSRRYWRAERSTGSAS